MVEITWSKIVFQCVKKHVLLEHGIESVILCNVENIDAGVSKSEFVFEPNKVFLNSKKICGTFELVKLIPNELFMFVYLI